MLRAEKVDRTRTSSPYCAAVQETIDCTRTESQYYATVQEIFNFMA
jgi:hypothetical protein